ncbi:hypothetical protein [Deinococcus sp. Leaf326]|uniref:hypothetical protein n=1 Tax=Deinococcus sp. Leaf326 TaxID=1736338 RepID=UPI000700057E|nr:hypothetical protein [Deinococcus sp. Leaf326]KQR22859.1 hypothetical protein ASF71_06750 [Deinococcus sp. Leaf326]
MTRASDRYLPSTPAAPAGRASDRYLPASPAIGADTPYSSPNAALNTARLYQTAVEKWRAGKSLTNEEAAALADMQASTRALDKVGVALQPFQVLSDLTKGVIGEVRGQGGSAQRGAQAAAGHVTYGLAEYLPGWAGARARGVTGAELLKGTKYEGNESVALAVELLADPSVLLTGAGVIAKGAATAGRLAKVETFARTAEGSAAIRDALKLANTRGDALIRAGDEITGVPAAVRSAAGSRPVQAARTRLAQLADRQLPGENALANAVRREGGGTVGDAFLTPDQKASIYTPEQLARDEFRNTTRLGVDDLGQAIKADAIGDAKYLTDITKGLSKSDAAEVNRLLGVFTTATKPEIAAEALRKLGTLGTRVGRDLEGPFVAAVKASDRVSQVNLGENLAARGLPAIVNPEVTKAVQEAQTGADLVAQTGKYTSKDGRPRGILMNQYVGRNDPTAVIARLMDGPEIPALAKVDEATAAPALTASVQDVPLPARPIEPVGTPGRSELPQNAPEVAARVEIPTPTAATPDAPTYTPQQVLDNLFGDNPVIPARAADLAPDAARLNTPPAETTPAPIREPEVIPPARDPVDPAPVPAAAVVEAEPVRVEPPTTPAQAVTEPTPPPTDAGPAPILTAEAAPVPVAKTPQSVLESVLSPTSDPYVALPSPAITRTQQADLTPIAFPAAPAERMVLRDVPTTYRTVEVDANALDWGSLPDNATRRAVLNSIPGAGNATFARDTSGALRIDRPNLTIPLGHPTISHYFPDEEVLAAGRTGTEIGERVITRKEMVPDWFNPREGTTLEFQRGQWEQVVKDANDSAFRNDFGEIQNLHERYDDTAWTIGDAYASYDRLVKPDRIISRAAANDYAGRVKALTGTPPTKGEVFQYRLALARYRRAENLRNLDGPAVATHLRNFYEANPEATLFEGVLNAAKEFGLGREGAKHLQQVLRQSESGFERRLSTLERKEFAQYLLGKDATRQGKPGGTLLGRLTRNPETVSEEFQQVFAQDVNALRLLDEQVRTRTAAIVRAETFTRYKAYLQDTGQLITQKKLRELQLTPVSRLTPDQLEMRNNAANAVSKPGANAGWKIMDRNVEGYFEKGDVVPWWAYFDLFGAGSVDDAAVGAATLQRGGLGVYDRLWSSMNAQLLGSPSSIVNDQIGQFLQMAMWGVTPDAMVEGIIRRATASPEQLKVMRESGIQSAKLESNIGANREALTRLASRIDGDTDMSRMERVVDGVLRFRERGTGLNPQAMTGAAGVAADVAHLGSGYLFQFRSMVSDLQRESLYFHRIALGDNPKAAAAYTNNVMLDMRLVPAYARVVRRYWPFFNWIAMSGPRSIVTVLRKPGIAAAYHRVAPASDNPNDPADNTRRLLARDGGYINLGADERSGARLYLDPRNWDPTNTLPQLLDWSGTKVGAVGLPWYANLAVTLQWGQDRFGRNIYDSVLNGGKGGFVEAYALDPRRTMMIAAQTFHQQFNPSYAPGSSRAQAFVRSVLAAAQLPNDGSKDITLAKTLADTPQGRAYLLYMQNGSFAALDRELKGTRESEYSEAPPSMARTALNYLLPIRAVNADQRVQGTALQALSVGQLSYQNWLAGQKKEYEQMEAGGASPAELRAKEGRIEQEAERRIQKLDYLDRVTR